MIILIDIEIPKDLYDGKNISCIYCVTNKINNRKYIGQTTNYRKRISEYRRLHVTMKQVMPIYREINNVGYDNFKIEIIHRCKPKSLTKFEDYYIRKYHTYDEKYGYNIRVKNRRRNTIAVRNKMSIAHTGKKQSSVEKKNRSIKIYAIKNNELIISDGAKLFGDLFKLDRSVITSTIKTGTLVMGYYVFYANIENRYHNWRKISKRRKTINEEYSKLYNKLNNIEIEGVETIYSYWDIYKLEYGDDTPYKLTQLSCVLNNTGRV